MVGQRIVLVTGASSGIGHAIASDLAAAGYRVIACGLEPPVAPIVPMAEFIQLDLTDANAVDRAIGEAVSRFGAIDVLVNNAGYALVGAIEETTDAEAEAQFSVNLFAAVRLARSVLPGMRAKGWGRIVNISSLLGFLPGPYFALYAASKHALEGFSRSLDHEVRRFGVRSLLIEPGFIRTGMVGHARKTASSLSLYDAPRLRNLRRMERRVARGSDASEVAGVVRRAIEADRPQMRYPVGRLSGISHAVNRLAPAAVVDRIVHKLLA